MSEGFVLFLQRSSPEMLCGDSWNTRHEAKREPVCTILLAQFDPRRHGRTQCDMSVGIVIDASSPRVTPPRMNSRNREWPYPPMTMKSAETSAA
jgi:hypothetical protein